MSSKHQLESAGQNSKRQKADESKAKSMPCPNVHLKELAVDHLYHLGLDSGMDLKGMFSDVKFVCMGGKVSRMTDMIDRVSKECGLPPVPTGLKIDPIGMTERYTMYKYGPIVCVNHGMGMPSILLLLHEVTKLLHYAGAQDPAFIRVGSCGGIGVQAGTVVITEQALNSKLEPFFELNVLGKTVRHSTNCDASLRNDLFEFGNAQSDITVAFGKTVATNDFYEEQARLDGFFCDHTESEQQAYLQHAHDMGVKNFEMESAAFCSFMGRAGLRSAVVCGVLLNRLKGDQVTSTASELRKRQGGAIELILRFIKRELANSK